MSEFQTLQLKPIGVIRTPWNEKHSAPRQPSAARDVRGRIELAPGDEYLHALEDLHSWSHIWVLFWFHQNSTWHPKVLPPRSAVKRGVFATRSPHRPNPIGLSVLRLERIEGRVLHVLDVDLLDGTPVLDIKPYVAYTDSVPAASSGWLEDPEAPSDPQPRYEIRYAELAEQQLAWLEGKAAFDLRAVAAETLRLGPTPHPYRRIRRLDARRFSLGVKDFRVHFSVDAEVVTVLEIVSGYRARVLADLNAQPTEQTSLEVHRAFVREFARS
ncbi:MAG TPA: tRNA (N6-threonylcarbamoyladenosine(37)-N6)-methyltransferase TrmO [Polyangiales bacterium]|nr:tRNA (N6-threonylcarbamoyladenosine(37)-N6)-methyltransferase TrmO [Polyangiales bacterium]